MPPVARGEGADTVFSKTGSGRRCQSPTDTTTDVCSGDVFVNNKGVVRNGDKVGAHAASGCGPDNSTLSLYSGSVFANNKEIGRIGDEYTADNIITSGSANVFAG